MALTFAIPDLHGRDDLLVKALSMLNAEYDVGGTIVFLGDYIDRGPESRQVVERLMRGPSDPKWYWICLSGNHETMFTEAETNLGRSEYWMQNGGIATMRSFGWTGAQDAIDFNKTLDQELRDWVRDLPLVYQDNHRVYVHAFIEDGKPMEKQNQYRMMWSRYRDSDVGGYMGKHVVHGHQAHVDGPKYFEHRTNLDTRAYETGRLCIGVFDDDVAGAPIKIIEVKI